LLEEFLSSGDGLRNFVRWNCTSSCPRDHVCCFLFENYRLAAPLHSTPKNATWFGRIFIFLAGSVGALQFGIAILKRKHILINPGQADRALQISSFVVEILFVAVLTPFLVMSIRQLIRREDQNKINQLITVFLILVWTYLLWQMIPGMAKELFSLLRYVIPTGWPNRVHQLFEV
jgi:hypothetical protein